jgi:hypothetical protein
VEREDELQWTARQRKGDIRGKEETSGMQEEGNSKGVNRNEMYSDAMRVAAIPIFKLIYRTLCEYSNSLRHFVRRFSRRHRMAVTRETQ